MKRERVSNADAQLHFAATRPTRRVKTKPFGRRAHRGHWLNRPTPIAGPILRVNRVSLAGSPSKTPAFNVHAATPRRPLSAEIPQ